MQSAETTRRRILDAATEEFAARGIAGARVDRIADASGASKPMLYRYFGSKEQLFEVVFTSHVIANSDRVPFDASDLPDYAARLYDDYLADPALLRLISWKRLERLSVGYLYPGLEENDVEHLHDIGEQQQHGSIRGDMEPADIWSLLISMASTWAETSITDVARPEDAAALHARRREALAAATRAAFSPPAPPRP